MSTPPTSRPSEMIQEMFLEAMEGQDRIDLPSMAQGITRLVQDDSGLRAALADEMLYQTIYTIGQRLLPTIRRHARQAQATLEARDRAKRGVVRLRGIATAQARSRILWESVFETVAPGQQVKLLAMTREEIISSITLRESRMATEQRWVGFLQRVAERMPIGSVVSDALTPDDLSKLYAQSGTALSLTPGTPRSLTAAR